MSKTPEIRFKEFHDDWEQRKLCKLADVKDSARIPNSKWATEGVPYIRASDLTNNDLTGTLFLSKEIFDYYKSQTGAPEQGDVLFNGGGDIGKALFKYDNSPIYVQGGAVLYVKTSKSQALNGEYLTAFFQSPFAKKYIEIAQAGGTMKHFTLGPAQDMPILYPDNKEQNQIGKFFSSLDNLITLHQRESEKLQIFKKSMLENCFPKNGEKVPKIRFSGFTGDWEQRKLGDLVTIERGGSPRPIDAYITDAQDGLNWVKIGDAPEQGRYITHTEEKIKPSGLSKTRQVFPGDLILSNSMSFGKPYIMGISGCIHDGWLLIRNNQDVFDLKFLCQMLGTEQMLAQYRQLAAGSTVNNLNKELVSNAVVKVPKKSEQEQIGAFLENLDNVITLHQRELTKLQLIKKSMLEKMFPKN